MSEKRVTVSLVQMIQYADTRGLVVHTTKYYGLPGFDYSQTCEALRSAEFEWVNTAQEEFDAKLAEGRNELPQKDAVTVSLVQVTEDTRHGTMIRETTPFRLPGKNYSQICAALLDAEFKEFGTMQKAIDAKLAEGEGCNE